MMVPPPWSIISGATALEQSQGPLRLTRIVRSQSASVVSSTGLAMWTPALLTRMSTRPSRSTVVRTSRSTSPVSETSAPMLTARPPAASMSRWTTAASSPSTR